MNAQENYEQLKRRNRRRLVGALIMVVIAAILLVIMLSRRTPQPVSAPQLDVRTASSANAASGTTTMASQVNVTAQVQSASAIVLEPVIQHNIAVVTAYPDVKKAYQAALSEAGENDRIVVFGSFHTVAEIIDLSSR